MQYVYIAASPLHPPLTALITFSRRQLMPYAGWCRVPEINEHRRETLCRLSKALNGSAPASAHLITGRMQVLDFISGIRGRQDVGLILILGCSVVVLTRPKQGQPNSNLSSGMRGKCSKSHKLAFILIPQAEGYGLKARQQSDLVDLAKHFVFVVAFFQVIVRYAVA